jgi:hypothetical protein
MKRLVTGSAIAWLMLTFLPTGIAPAANNTATTLFPLDGPNQLETHTFLNCFKSDGHCDFIAGADMRTPDGVTGFPPSLWARQPPRFARRTGWPTWTPTPPASSRGS